MKYEPEIECKVFLAVKELGEATSLEVFEYLRDQEKLEINKKDLNRYLGRWKAKKIFAVSFKEDETLFKLADIPAWFSSGIMAIVKGSVNDEMNIAIEGLNERLKKEGRIIRPSGVYSEFKSFRMTFETIDPILGGWSSSDSENLMFPNQEGKPFIPANWFYGWIRDNAGLVNLPSSICYHMGFSTGKFLDKPELSTIKLKVKVGLATYEKIEPKTRFEVVMRFPFRGTTLKDKGQIQAFFKLLEEAPLRGFGANSRALGGRIKLVKMDEI